MNSEARDLLSRAILPILLRGRREQKAPDDTLRDILDAAAALVLQDKAIPNEAHTTVARIAQLARAVGLQAGVSAVETAGMVISYLAVHPDQIEDVLANGIFDLPEGWWRDGCLTWLAGNGNIIAPQTARFAATIRKMERP